MLNRKESEHIVALKNETNNTRMLEQKFYFPIP